MEEYQEMEESDDKLLDDPADKLTDDPAERVNFRFLYSLEQSSQKDIIEWCFKQGLFGRVHKCYRCGKIMKLAPNKHKVDGYHFACRSKKPEHHIKCTVRKGSVFEDSRISIVHSLLLMHMWLRKVPVFSIKAELMINENTTRNRISFYRDLCMELCVQGSEAVGGAGLEVEVYEAAQIIKSDAYKGQTALTGKCVFIGCERGSNKCFVSVVIKRNCAQLLAAIREWVYAGTTVISSLWEKYDCLSDEEWLKIAMEHSLNFKEQEPHDVKGSWINVKRALSNSNTRKNSMLFDGELAESIWRKRSKDESTNIMNHFMKGIRILYPFSDDLEFKDPEAQLSAMQAIEALMEDDGGD